MKIFAYYLPQFHTIPENDKWWGKGFTEWTNVKKATPLYKNHIQPKVPLNNNYYCLDDINTLKWQEKLMNDYKVDGLIFYHYYFKGKKLLEKPAEMLLKNKDINIKYFFCWANHSWYRSWEGSKEILLEQTYGKKEDWEKHFNYLLPFFKDKRYQKKDNKPLFMVFKAEFIEKKEMFNFFNKKCIENGFNGICIIESKNSCKDNDGNQITNEEEYICYKHLREPLYSLSLYSNKLSNLPKRCINKAKRVLNQKNFKFVIKYDADKLYKCMCADYLPKENIIRGAFFEWDNTPRHSYRGYIVNPVSKRMFMKYMDLIKSEEYVFINAWNEWAEGMTLEPTEQNKYKYLEWIKEVKKDENRSDGM